MTELLVFIGGIVVGGLVAWLFATSRARASGARALAEVQGELSGSQSVAEEVRRQLAQRDGELAQLRTELQQQQQERVAADTRLKESTEHFAEQRRLLEDAEKKLKEAFTALSAESLRQNGEAFAKQAAEKVRPLAEALRRYEEEIKQIEKSRQTAYGSLNEQLKGIASTHQTLSRETQSLVHALRTPQVKGRWGELQLRRTVEVAGMASDCDYIEQYSMNTDDGRQRPDMLVRLPGGRTIVIDSKVSTDAYLDALGAAEPTAQQEHLTRYVRAIRTHVQGLSGKAYWSQFESAPDFVVMFVPGESFFSAALEQDRALIEDAIRNRVILASPTTLIALLRTVAYSWQQAELIENSRRIGDTAKDLFERVCRFATHFGKVGDRLRQASESYNDAAGSWERRVVPMGRKITELGVRAKQEEFAQLNTVDTVPREGVTEAAPLPEPDEDP